jgi:predicted transcriptional regulator of viral defense system
LCKNIFTNKENRSNIKEKNFICLLIGQKSLKTQKYLQSLKVNDMVGYEQLAKMNTFTLDDVYALVNNRKTASSLVMRLSKKGYVKKIRNNLYSCVNLADGQTIASRYHIACAVNDSSYISHHSAFEYMGMSNQVFNEVYVSSSQRFTDFEFGGIQYKFVPSKFDSGVIQPKNTQGIRVASLERTIVDSIKDFEKIGGLEELLNCIDSVRTLDEKNMVEYLDAYGIQYLYQKTGYILEHYKDQIQVSDEFLDHCKSRIGKSTRYLTPESKNYCNEWKLIVPDNIFQLTEQGGLPLV